MPPLSPPKNSQRPTPQRMQSPVQRRFPLRAQRADRGEGRLGRVDKSRWAAKSSQPRFVGLPNSFSDIYRAYILYTTPYHYK